jgi:ATP-dependent exoDNAse (exonuclease V) beta subunit
LRDGAPVLGAIVETTLERTADATAAEIERVLATVTVRDRDGNRPARPDDIAILFRARAGHQYFEEALETRGIRTYVYKGLGFFDAPEVQDVHALLRYLAEPESDLRAAELLRSRIVRLSDSALAQLAPGFAAALRGPAPVDQMSRLADIDRSLLERARAAVTTWLPLADRVTPSELVDRILRETAYAFELRGRRLMQARENLKKIRGLVRRVESRGYATLGRLADYFETLRAGDESNAIVEASGCVSLMTIHAAKGLEFPIVFVVNLQAPGRGRSNGFSIIERGPADEPEVAFGTTEATRLEDQRDEEELRRLFYVAATRARDRLYLGMEIDDRGKLVRRARSLAGLLPDDLVQALASASVGGAENAVWTAPSGTFAFRLCRPPAQVPEGVAPESVTSASAAAVDCSPLSAGRQAVVLATGDAATEPGAMTADADGRSDRLTGTLVHRLFQRRVPPDVTEDDLTQLAMRLARTQERGDADDLASHARRAAATYLAFRRRADLTALLASGHAEYEVPFSFRPDGRPDEVVRGAIDCLVQSADGSLTVLELKTGAKRTSHGVQAELYASAVRAAWPGCAVRVKILYPD